VGLAGQAKPSSHLLVKNNNPGSSYTPASGTCHVLALTNKDINNGHGGMLNNDAWLRRRRAGWRGVAWRGVAWHAFSPLDSTPLNAATRLNGICRHYH